MGILTILHKAVFDRRFVAEAHRLPAGWLLRQVVMWYVVCVLVSAVSHTVYLVLPGHPFAQRAAAVLEGCTIVDGVLSPVTPTPYAPPSSLVGGAVGSLLPGIAELASGLPDSSLLVDTSARVAGIAHPYVRLGRDSVTVASPLSKGSPAFGLAYADLFGNRGVVVPTAEVIAQAVRARWLSVLVLYLQWDLVLVLFRVIWAMPFLLIAAYILNMTSDVRIGAALMRASVVLVPVLAGLGLEAVAGVDLTETWYVLVSVGFFLILRAGRYGRPGSTPAATAGRDSDG